jgi:hypothetical protein
LLALAGAALLATLPLTAFVRIGEQPYRPYAFAERVRLLGDVPGIEASWGVPALLALGASASAVLAAVVPQPWHRRLLPFAAALLVVATALVYRMVRNSTLASAAIGLHLLAVGTALVIAAAVTTRKYTTREQ